jgi:hypothetical protein
MMVRRCVQDKWLLRLCNDVYILVVPFCTIIEYITEEDDTFLSDKQGEKHGEQENTLPSLLSKGMYVYPIFLYHDVSSTSDFICFLMILRVLPRDCLENL